MQAQQLRHQYLESLGITSWISRGQLPGAAPSPPWAADFVYNKSPSLAVGSDLQASAASSALTQHSGQQVKSLAASLAAPAVDTDKISRDAQAIAQEVVSHLPAAAAVIDHSPVPIEPVAVEPVLRATENPVQPIITTHSMPASRSKKPPPVMRLMFWQYPEVLVVDSLPTQTRGTLTSAKYEKLLNNMIVAMQFSAVRVDVGAPPYVLNWPTLAGGSIDQGWDQAVSAVQYKLAKLLQSYSPKLVLMLGESSAQMLLNVEDDFAAMQGVVFSLRSNIKAITSYSLTQMLNVPGCKRDVWQDLQKVMIR